MQDDEAVREFLIESNENLAKLDRELVELEQHPGDTQLVASIFRTIHTIKGTSGFFGFSILGSITHIAENILSQIRDKQRELTPALVSLILETVDAVKTILTAISRAAARGKTFTRTCGSGWSKRTRRLRNQRHRLQQLRRQRPQHLRRHLHQHLHQHPHLPLKLRNPNRQKKTLQLLNRHRFRRRLLLPPLPLRRRLVLRLRPRLRPRSKNLPRQEAQRSANPAFASMWFSSTS